METSEITNLIVSPIKSLFFYHKKKLTFFILALCVFALTLFPYSDLTSYSKEKINQLIKSSGSSVDYSKIGLNFVPFGVQTSDFEFLSKSFNKPLKVDRITLRPHLLSLMKFQPGGAAILSGLFSGDASLNFSLNGKTKEKTQKFNFSTELSNLSLADLFKFQNLPYKISGNLNGELNASGEDSFRLQPQGDFQFTLSDVAIPSTITVPNLGDIPLPKKVVWDNSNLFGKFENGRVTITEGTIGTKKAPINGRYKGYISCAFNKSGASVSATCTDYMIRVELELNALFQRKLADNLSGFLKPQNVKVVTLPQGGKKYLFSVQGNAARRYRPPRVSSLNSFD